MVLLNSETLVALEYAKKNDADLLIATDPDCDRVGIAVKNNDGELVLMTGNQVGVLLLDYVCSMRRKHNTMPKDPVFIKTIVTTDMGKAIADSYGVRTIDVLTGFKFIGEQVLLLETQGKEKSYILGFEESYGYLSGSYVRDKDAVNGVFMIVEMFAYYHSHSISLLEKLEELYKKYGYYSNYLKSYEFEGSSGFKKMNDIMNSFRNGFNGLGESKVSKLLDYSKGIDGLPKSNVVKIFLDDGSTFVVRPSGTEPKLKIYLSVLGKGIMENNRKSGVFFQKIEEML